jgi:hypothetical protein
MSNRHGSCVGFVVVCNDLRLKEECVILLLPNKFNPMNVVSELICPVTCTYLI